MPNNFRILPVGAYYISKEGVDIGPTGLDPNDPKATLTRYGDINVMGAGVYKGVIVLNSVTNTSATYIADGLVVINVNGGSIVATPSTSDANIVSLNTSSFNKHTIYVKLNGLSYTATRSQYANNVVFENGFYTHTGTGTAQTMVNCTFEAITFSATAIFSFTHCRLFNSLFTIGSASTLSNSYVDSATILTWPTFVADFNAGRFTHNNFRGIINISGVLYELKQDSDGNAINPNPSVLDLGTIVTGLYTTRKCFSQDPEFLNIEKRDYFSVDVTSPMLFADSTGIGNIGNVKITTVVKALDTEFATGTITDLITSANDLVLDSPATTGQLISQPIEAFPIAQPIQSLDIAKILNFNSSEVAGTSENNNVVIVGNFADGTAGANPRRLTYEMRWTDSNTMPLVDADWTCQNYFPISGSAGDYFKFEQDVKPLVDVNGLGNGDPDFNGTGAVGIKAKWLQIRITIIGGIG